MLRALVVTAGLATSCVVIDPKAQLCQLGSDGCACTQGGGCDPGLECREDTCVDPHAPPETMGTPGTMGQTDDSGDSENGDTGPEDAMPNYVFVTSTQHSAAFGGLEGADAICQMRAEAAGLPGEYRAWLSSSDTHAKDRIGDARGWVFPDGTPFVRDLGQLLSGVYFFPPRIDEHGALVTSWPYTWTGTLGDGNGMSFSDDDFCQDWTYDGEESHVLQGEINAGRDWWSDRWYVPCNDSARFYCFGIDHQVDIEVEPTQGRVAFVSNAGLPANAGRDAADDTCQSEAAAAGLPGDFLALMGVVGEAPADRFNLGGAQWVRPDGMPLFAGDDPMGPLLTPLALKADGTPVVAAMAWLGSENPLAEGTLDTTCQDWSELSGTASLATSRHLFWTGWGIGGGTRECTTGQPVLCFEE